MLRTPLPLRLLAACLLVAGCAGVPPADVSVETGPELIAELGRAGWAVRPTQLVALSGLASTGAAYTAEQVPPDEHVLLVFDTTEDGEPMPADRVDADVTQLRRLFAGRGVVIYRQPRLLVVTFGRARTALGDRLERWLGVPVTAAPRGERSGT